MEMSIGKGSFWLVIIGFDDETTLSAGGMFSLQYKCCVAFCNRETVVFFNEEYNPLIFSEVNHI
jgi:hypothetical protein